jgi:replicative DNA helicase
MDRPAESVDRLPPHNREAECYLLGSLLRNSHLVDEVTNYVRANDFYVYAHVKIFESIQTLRSGESNVDVALLGSYLLEQKLLEEIGGVPYLFSLWDNAPSAANVRYYADLVRGKAIIRNLIRACGEVQQDAFNEAQPPQELLDSAERRILEIAELGITGEMATLGEAIQDAYKRLDFRRSRGDEISGIRTGFLDLDNLLGGMQNNELVIIAARPSVGKTAFALNLLRNVVVEDRTPALFVSLEQAKIELAERLLCCQARIDSYKLRRGHLSEEETHRLIEAGSILSESPLFIDDTPAQNLLRIAANARRLKRRHDLKLIVIDYLQLIDPDNKKDSRQEQVATISRRLKGLARELELPVVALAQVNRGSEDRQDHRPRLSDLRESGAIEQDADTVMLLHRPDYHEPGQQEGLIEVIIGKQRNGPTGEVNLMYVKQFMRFENFAVDHAGSYNG